MNKEEEEEGTLGREGEGEGRGIRAIKGEGVCGVGGLDRLGLRK